MGWASRKNTQEGGASSVIIGFSSHELRDEYCDFVKRTGALLESAQRFLVTGCELDANAPDFAEKIAPFVENFFIDFMLNYQSPAQLEADLQTLGKVRVVSK